MELPETIQDITAEWLNQALHENGFLNDAAIISVGTEPIGIGQGFSSEMARLKVTYEGNQPHLPATMIAKLPTSYAGISKLTRIANFYEREIRFYLEIAPRSPIRTPGLIYGGVDSENGRFVLLLEDCARYVLADPGMTGLDYEQTRLITVNMADFHTRWWDAPDLLSFPWMPKAHIDTGGRLFRKSWDACIQMDEFKKILPEGGLAAGARINEHYSWLMDNAPKDKLTIQHNDLRSDNIFFDPENRDNPVVVFDWAMAYIERGVGDIAFLLGTSLTTGLRRKVEKDLIRQYHECLLAGGISDYSFEQCRADYLTALLFKTFVPVIAFARVDISDARSTEIWSRTINRWFSAIVDNDATSLLP